MHKMIDKILVFLVAFLLLAIFGYYLDQKAFDEAADKIIRTPVIVRDTIRDTTVIHDTTIKEINKYITSVSYTNAYPPRLDTFEVHQGKTELDIVFQDGELPIENAVGYKVLCNGRLYEKKDDPEDEPYRDCAGEWVIIVKVE